MKYEIYLTETTAAISQKMAQALAKEINKIGPGVVPKLEKKLRQGLDYALYHSTVYRNVVGGSFGQSLAAELGFPAGAESQYLDAIIEVLLNEIYVDFQPAVAINGQAIGYFFCYCIKSGFETVLTHPMSTIETEDASLPWLEWLLFEGDKVIISGHQVQFGNYSGKLKYTTSRSGKAIMVKKDSGVWRVPPKYAGTFDNNWVTRSVDKIIKIMQDEFEKIIQKEFRVR